MNRKLFFGLFVFPLVIAVGMAVLLCTVVFLTNEKETPESLITAIKTGSPSKRWQKAFELSNELNRSQAPLRTESVLRETIHILRDPVHYDAKTRGYMALALGHFKGPDAAAALREALHDDEEDVQLYALWSLGVLGVTETSPAIRPFLKNEKETLRKMSAYVLGVIGDKEAARPLKLLLDDPALDVRWNAALALARLGDDSGLEVLEKMLERQELTSRYQLSDGQIEKIMVNAAKGLALIKRPESFKILESISKTDKSLKVRQAALEAIKYERPS